jgi:glycerate-2-kinase
MKKDSSQILLTARKLPGTTVRKDALRALRGAILAADPQRMIRVNLRLRGTTLHIGSLTFNLSDFTRILVVGGGKASGLMALEVERILGDFITGGVVNVPDYQEPKLKSARILFNGSKHPLPSEKGVSGVKKMLKLVRSRAQHDFIICLLSGGSSALMPLPVEGVSLQDKQKVTQLLLESGANIDELNSVRKHLSQIKGGRLAERAYPATMLSLILSDVVGDRLDVVGSGPTAPDTTTFADARDVLVKRSLWDKVPAQVRKVLVDGTKGRLQETQKPGSRSFDRVHNIVIGSNKDSRSAAARELRKIGYEAMILPNEIKGEARNAGMGLASLLVEVTSGRSTHRLPYAIVAGGETTVRVRGNGLGGRNQELALSAAITLSGSKNVAIASIGTDGMDGPTDAAGAIADGETVPRGRKLGLVAEDFLEDNDSYSFFKKLSDLIITGPTGTNVNDIAVGLARPNHVGR